MSENVVLARRAESSPATLALGRILSCLAEAQRIASGMGQETSLATKAENPVSRRKERTRPMRWHSID